MDGAFVGRGGTPGAVSRRYGTGTVRCGTKGFRWVNRCRQTLMREVAFFCWWFFCAGDKDGGQEMRLVGASNECPRPSQKSAKVPYLRKEMLLGRDRG